MSIRFDQKQTQLACRLTATSGHLHNAPMTAQEPTSNDWFDSDLNWFMGHVASLAMSPEDCCADQGNYFVAGELHYFLLQPLSLLDDGRGLLSADQVQVIQRLRASVEAVPKEARSGAPSAAGSLSDMRHSSWEAPRQIARQVLDAVGPLWRERTVRS
jgi:hypothetical protein